MGCSPQSGGCEHRRLLPFISYLNDTEATDYELERCLDVDVRDTAQPEAMYRSSLGILVIERKSVVWPSDYAERHAADHFFAEKAMERLSPLCGDRPALLEMPSGFSINRMALEQLADKLASEIAVHLSELKSGKELRLSPCRFRFQSPGERNDWEPSAGLCISFQTRRTTELYDPSAIPAGLVRQIDRLIASAKRKFTGYSDCRRILLLEAFGELQWRGSEWWSELLRARTDLGSIEVWLALEDSGEDWEGTFYWQVLPEVTGGA